MRGTIAILTGRGPACDGLSEWIEREVPLGTVQILRLPGNQIAWQRNQAVARLRSDDEWLLFVDADCIPPRGTLPRLLSHEVGVVGSLIIERVAPFAVCAVRTLEPFSRFQIEDFPASETLLRPVASVGTGCLLIRRAVFDALPRPWFRVGQIPGGEDLLAEDLDFCLRCAQVGFPVFLDPGVRVGHETKVTLFPGDGEIAAQFESPIGALPYRVPLPVEDLRDLHL
jgi:GT2 family glycosyltransferase